MSNSTVMCSKLQRELPALEKAPVPGPLGEEIRAKVSAEAWAMWSKDMMIKVINEYRLDLTDEKAYGFLIDQMKAFLGLADGTSQVVEVENADRGRAK